MDFDEIAYYLGLVLVGCIWGITNPFMEQGANSSSEKETEDFGWKSFIKKVLNLKFLLPFLINQSGSGFYYFLLGQTKISIGPLITNSVNCVVTYFTEMILKKKKLKIGTIAGVSLIILGVSICLQETESK